MQYKHGLTLALRPLHLYSDQEVAQVKSNKLSPILAAFDNINIEKIIKDKTRINTVIFNPNYVNESILPMLMKEDNIIRYVFPEEIAIDDIKSLAFKIKDSIIIFRDNLLASVDHDNGVKPIRNLLPAPEIGKFYCWTNDNPLYSSK